MAKAPDVHGVVQPGFEPVREAFIQNFTDRGEYGASVCIMRRGEVVVDLWGGKADVGEDRDWQHDTLGVLFSSTKGLAAICLLMLHDRGLLDYDAPVASYWPEFAVHGKQDITVRTLLCHRAGLIALEKDLSLADMAHPHKMAEVAANTVPAWTPGEGQGYHGVSYGYFVSELFRRIAGESIGAFLAREVAAPLDADVHIGLDAEHDRRVATLYTQRKRDVLTKILPRVFLSPKVEGRVYRSVMFGGAESHTRRAFANPSALGTRGVNNFNKAQVRRLELPWANGIGSARGLARAYHPLALDGAHNGVRLVAEHVARLPVDRHSWSYDRVLHKPMGFTLGFVKEEPQLFSPSVRAFGHPGAGGALGWADPDEGLSIGYVLNRMDFHIRSKRALALCHALYSCV